MSASRFVDGHVFWSKGKRRFEKWLSELGYEPASEIHPGAIHASALVDDFLSEYPDLARDRMSLEDHADEIGYVSDCLSEDTDEQDGADNETDGW